MNDLLLNTNGDLDLSGGDLNIGFSDFQHKQHLLIAQKGSIKQFPDCGVGIENFINESEIEEMLQTVTSEFTKDGQTVKSISFDENTGELNYDANYNS